MARIINFPHRQAPGGTQLAAARPQGGSDSPKSRPASSNVRRYISPDELRSLTHDWTAVGAYSREPLDAGEWLRSRIRPTRRKRLLAFMRLNGEAISFWFALAVIALLVGTVGGAFIGWLA